MSLPQKLPLELMQTQWASQLNPVLANPTTNPGILTGVKLVSGTNVINHFLGQQMQGWKITDIDAVATIYRPSTAPLNNLTLTLIASAPVTVNIEVF